MRLPSVGGAAEAGGKPSKSRSNRQILIRGKPPVSNAGAQELPDKPATAKNRFGPDEVKNTNALISMPAPVRRLHRTLLVFVERCFWFSTARHKSA
jgi:hypothetical protein